MFVIISIVIIAIAWGLIVLVHKANVFFMGEKKASNGSTLGGCVTVIIIIGAILALCYFWDVYVGEYDLNTPIRR